MLRSAAIATLAISTAGGWYHNAADFPGMPIYAPEMLATIVPPAILVAGWWWRPGRLLAWSTALWAVLSLIVGGLLSVLPLPVWPFEPAQTAFHYRAHLFYAVTQVPLVGFAVWVLGRSTLEV